MGSVGGMLEIRWGFLMGLFPGYVVWGFFMSLPVSRSPGRPGRAADAVSRRGVHSDGHVTWLPGWHGPFKEKGRLLERVNSTSDVLVREK